MNLYDVAEVSLAYNSKVSASERISIRSSRDAFDVLYNNWNLEAIEHREEFKILLLNRANKVLGLSEISKGGISGTVVDSRMIFQTALKANAIAVILCHNHPSGNLMPSEADLQITKKLKEGGKLLDISVLDHIIITPGSKYSSLADNGYL